jgi:hypothetical protein
VYLIFITTNAGSIYVCREMVRTVAEIRVATLLDEIESRKPDVLQLIASSLDGLPRASMVYGVQILHITKRGVSEEVWRAGNDPAPAGDAGNDPAGRRIHGSDRGDGSRFAR